MDDVSRAPKTRGRRWLRRAAWAFPLFTMAVYAGISLYSADQLTRPHNRREGANPAAFGDASTRWSVRTDDGLTLRGWYYRGDEGKPLIVLVHGLWQSWLHMAGLGHDLHEKGYGVLLFDLRGHGQSDPSRVSMGRRETGDLRAVLAWAQTEGFEPERVGWVGYSMGASALLIEAARNPKIKVAVIDSPFGNLPELLNTQLSRHSHLPQFFNPGILAAARYAYGVRTDDLVPIRSANAWGARPLLLIHGEADSTVPVRQARAIASAAGPTCQAVWLPGVEHNEAYRDDPEHYVARVDAFFRRHLSQ